MGSPSPEAPFFAQRALTHARLLARVGRGSTTPAERQAAEYVQSQLIALGFKDINLQPFTGERSLWLFVALICGLALVGHGAFWLLRRPAGDLLAVVIAELSFGFSAYLVWRRFTWSGYPLEGSLPHAASQNVIARISPTEDVHRRLVLIAHLDSHRAVFWFASDLLVRIFTPFAFITMCGIFLAGPLYILAALTHLQIFAWVGLSLAFFHFLGWFTGVTADLGRYSPGANDNASSVGNLLAVAEHLANQPMQHTETWLAFTGCEESDASGIAALVREYREDLKSAWFIDFEMVGIGDSLGYVRQEGSFERVKIPPEVESQLNDVGEAFGLRPLQTPLFGASTECGLLIKHGYKAACVVSFRDGAASMPEWHRLTDTPDKLQLSALDRVQEFTWALLQRLDQLGPRP